MVATPRFFLTLALTAFVSLFALRLVFDWPNAILRFTEAALRKIWSVLAWVFGETVTGLIVSGWNWLLGHLGALLPGWASPAVPSFAEYPLSGIVALVFLALVFFKWSKALEAPH